MDVMLRLGRRTVDGEIFKLVIFFECCGRFLHVFGRRGRAGVRYGSFGVGAGAIFFGSASHGCRSGGSWTVEGSKQDEAWIKVVGEMRGRVHVMNDKELRLMKRSKRP